MTIKVVFQNHILGVKCLNLSFQTILITIKPIWNLYKLAYYFRQIQMHCCMPNHTQPNEKKSVTFSIIYLHTKSQNDQVIMYHDYD